MTKPLTPWQKQYRQILRDIKAKRITVDHSLYLADSDDLIMLVRGDLLPVAYHTAWFELEMVFRDYGDATTVPFSILIKAATTEERARIEESMGGWTA